MGLVWKMARAAGFVGGAAWLLPAARAQALPAGLVGSWKIVKILPTTGRACWGPERAGTLVGTTLHYAAGKLAWQGGEEQITEALTRTLSAQTFRAEYGFELAELGVRAGAVEEVDLQHEDADVTGSTTEVPGDTVLLVGPGRIVMSACGVYYSALKVGR